MSILLEPTAFVDQTYPTTASVEVSRWGKPQPGDTVAVEHTELGILNAEVLRVAGGIAQLRLTDTHVEGLSVELPFSKLGVIFPKGSET